MAASLPPFASSLVDSAEVLAYLHLSGNAVNDESDDALTIVTTIDEQKLTFTYQPLCVCCGSDGTLGKAVVYAPAHDPDRVVVAFRAVRIDMKLEAGNRHDVASMLDTHSIGLSWMPSKAASTTAGIARHAGSIWALGADGGLCRFLTTCKAKYVHFTGLSLAGALAQVVALRSVLEPTLGMDERAHVITFGAVPWANTAAAADYKSLLGARAVHLCTHMKVVGNRFVLDGGMPWWEKEKDDCEPDQSVYGVIDPLTCAFMPKHALLCSTFAIDEGVSLQYDAGTKELEDVWATGARLRQLTRFPPEVVQRRLILELMAHQLPEGHALLLDYMRLHRGRAYQAALRGLVRSARVDSARVDSLTRNEVALGSADEVAAAVPSPPEVAAAVPTPPPKRPSKRAVDCEAENEKNNVPVDVEPPAQQRGGMTKIASYGSLANEFELSRITSYGDLTMF